MNDTALDLLIWASRAAALLAVAVYFLVLARRPQWVRLLNGSALFFTGSALGIVSGALPRAPEQGARSILAVTVALLIGSVAVQAGAALKNRRAWDGIDRRRAGDSFAEGDAS